MNDFLIPGDADSVLALRELLEQERERRKYDWEAHARPDQLPPKDSFRYWLICAGRGWGKALSLDTPIPTTTGWTTMGEVQVGDRLFDERGVPCNVTFITDVMHDRKCYDVVFDDGTVIVADAEHQWFTWTHRARKAAARRIAGATSTKPQCQRRPECEPAVRTTEEIRATLLYSSRERNHSIDVCGPLNLPDADLPIDPYTLGVWLGDGDSKAAVVTGADPEILGHIKDAGFDVGEGRKDDRSRAVRYAVGRQPALRCIKTGRMLANGSLQSLLRLSGLICNKHIPPAYLRASEEQRMALLQGLIDTDGYIEPGGNCEFTSTNPELARGTLELVLSLGFKATMGDGRATLNQKDCGPKYRVSFTPHRIVCRLPRKQARQHAGKAQAKRVARRYIAEVRERGSVPVRCLTVDSPSHLFLASKAFIPTHNSRTGAEYVRSLAKRSKHGRIAIIGATAADVRDVMVEGDSGIMACSAPDFRPLYEPSKRQLTWPNGVIGKLYSAEEPERLRGPQHHAGWLDELAAWEYPEAFTQFKLGFRLGNDLRCVITTTPRPCQSIRELVKQSQDGTGRVIITRGRTYDNRANLAPEFFEDIIRQYEGTRLGRQELEGELLEDTPGALWNTVVLDRTRWREKAPQMSRIVVGIDPSVTSSSESDECGISVCGKGLDGDAYVLADRSGIYSPNEWAKKAIDAYHEFQADVIVAETNNGGDLVGNTILAVDPSVPFRKVTASRGKIARAEPVSALFEQSRAHLVGNFERLEEQLCAFAPDGYTGRGSPDRADAMVWAVSELMLGSGTVTMFPEFRPKRRQSEPDNALHVVVPEGLKDWWPRYISAHHGFSSAAHWWCQSPDGRLHVYRELVRQDMSPEQFGMAIAELSQKEANVSRMVPVWLGAKAFDRINGKSVAVLIAEGIARQVGADRAFLFVHNDAERAIHDPSARYRAIESRLRKMPAGFLNVQAVGGKDQAGWDIARELLRWSGPQQGRTPEPDLDYARELARQSHDEFVKYMREHSVTTRETLPLLLISPECGALIQAMSGAVRSPNDESSLAQNANSFVLQSLRIGALASREEQLREPLDEFVERRLDKLPDGASWIAREIAAQRAEADWQGTNNSEPLTFRRVMRQ